MNTRSHTQNEEAAENGRDIHISRSVVTIVQSIPRAQVDCVDLTSDDVLSPPRPPARSLNTNVEFVDLTKDSDDELLSVCRRINRANRSQSLLDVLNNEDESVCLVINRTKVRNKLARNKLGTDATLQF